MALNVWILPAVTTKFVIIVNVLILQLNLWTLVSMDGPSG